MLELLYHKSKPLITTVPYKTTFLKKHLRLKLEMKMLEEDIVSGFQLTYCDLGNTIHFSIFMMQIFPPSQKITIPEYNAVSNSEIETPFFLLLLKTISISQALTNCVPMYVHTQNHKFYKMSYLIIF